MFNIDSLNNLQNSKTVIKMKSLIPSKSHLNFSTNKNSSSNLANLSETTLKSIKNGLTNELEKKKPLKPSFLINHKISDTERLKIRNINRKLIKNIDEKFGFNKQENFKIKSIKNVIQSHIDKSISKTFTFDFLRNYKIMNHVPKLHNLKNNSSGSKSKNIASGTTTIYFKKDPIKNNYLENLLLMQQDSSQILKRAWKWKNLKWLFENKKGKIH